MAAKKHPRPVVNVRRPPSAAPPDLPPEAKAIFVGATEPMAPSTEVPVPSPRASGRKARKGAAPPAAGEGSRWVALASGEKRRRINMLLPDELARRLRRHCADEDQTMTVAIIAALETFLKSSRH